MTTIEISSITGLNNPYFIEVCDVYGSNCVLLSQIFTTVPPSNTLYLPPQFNSSPSVMVKVTTLDGCVKTEIIDCIFLNTPTPTPTPTEPNSDICFSLGNEALGSYSCTIGKSGFFNGKPYYQMLLPDCSTTIVQLGYVWWNDILNQWNYTRFLGDNTTYFYGYNENPSFYPLSDMTYPWIDVNPTVSMVSSTLGDCPPTEVCFTLGYEAIGTSYSCTITNSGWYGSKPYYEILDIGCTTPLGFVWWDWLLGQWSFTDVVGGYTGAYYAYNQNPSLYPLSDITYPWVILGAFEEINSTLGNCPTPTPTPTNTVTPTPTSTLGLTNYLAQQCCPTTQYWTLPNGDITDFSTATPFGDCEDVGTCLRQMRDSSVILYCQSGITISSRWTYETQPCGAKAIKSINDICGDSYWYFVQNNNSTFNVYQVTDDGFGNYTITSDVGCCSESYMTGLTNNEVISASSLYCPGPTYTGTGFFDWFNRIIDLSGDNPNLHFYPYYNSGTTECLVSGNVNTQVVSITNNYSPLNKTVKLSDGYCYNILSTTSSASTTTWVPPTIYDDCTTCNQTITPTPTPTITPTPTLTPTNTTTPTETPTNTPTPTVTETPTNTPTNTPTMTNTPTISPLDFTLTYSCDGLGNATIQMTSYIGGSGSYESGNGFFSSESAALANTSWIPSTSFAIGVGPGSSITYWMVIKDSLGNLKAKSILVSCGVPA